LTVALGELHVHRLGVGTMSLTGPGVWGEPRDRREAQRVLQRAVELGVDFFDTADSYGPQVAESLLGETLHPNDGIVVATKAGLMRSGPGRWSRNGRPEHLRSSCHASLARLRIEQIDLFQLHAVDPHVPIEESLGALADLRREGVVRHVGVCNVDVEQLLRALAVESVVSVQNRFSLADRSSRGVLDLCAARGLVFVAWAPLAKGTLTFGDALNAVGARHGATAAQISLAWLLAQSPAALPIPGTSSVSHLEENAGALNVSLTSDDLATLDRTAFSMPTRGKAGAARRALRRLVSR